MYVRQALDLLEGLISSADDKEMSVSHVQKLIIFAVMWSLGALLEIEDRKKVRNSPHQVVSSKVLLMSVDLSILLFYY